jgi:hypothetical protein
MVPTVADLSGGQACCAPISEDRLPAEAAAVFAPAFKALGDPVRSQLMSMIASAPDGEICVCELTPAFACLDRRFPIISRRCGRRGWCRRSGAARGCTTGRSRTCCGGWLAC